MRYPILYIHALYRPLLSFVWSTFETQDFALTGNSFSILHSNIKLRGRGLGYNKPCCILNLLASPSDHTFKFMWQNIRDKMTVDETKENKSLSEALIVHTVNVRVFPSTSPVNMISAQLLLVKQSCDVLHIKMSLRKYFSAFHLSSSIILSDTWLSSCLHFEATVCSVYISKQEDKCKARSPNPHLSKLMIVSFLLILMSF